MRVIPPASRNSSSSLPISRQNTASVPFWSR
jgi:hypothetical protein